MKSKTKAELAEQSERLSRENTLLSYALAVALHREKPVATERWKDSDGGTYVADLYHPLAPHGGFVIVTFRYPGQSDSHAVYYADAWTRESYAHGIALGNTKLAVAAEQIAQAQRRAWQLRKTGS